eukprot:scaffold12756_cov117-Skeletonema_dohrnii-CCMP3373.AAC.5
MELDLTSPIVLSHQHHAESFPLRSSHTDNTYALLADRCDRMLACACCGFLAVEAHRQRSNKESDVYAEKNTKAKHLISSFDKESSKRSWQCGDSSWTTIG